MHCFVVLGFVFSYTKPGTSPKSPVLCRVGRKTLTSNQYQMRGWFNHNFARIINENNSLVWNEHSVFNPGMNSWFNLIMLT